ncbi:MAG: alanine dehydrogenase [Saprospiraceae bacterium]|nr:alanine dehydrogenase [Bacteroidia bacterium]NNE14157.1 alanine dehydrogenase [Saprospiraceae bacterium]NNL93528.1 alanine dehydrogenase [Saprospiraceae bacterium]
MPEDGKKHNFSDFFTEGQYQTQSEVLAIDHENKRITIGIPKEGTGDENRIALVPNSIRTLIGYGHTVKVESKAGVKSNYTDHDYSEAGAIIEHSKENLYQSDIIVKVSPPTIEEIELFHPNQVLISPILLPNMSEEYLLALKRKRVIAIAMEYLRAEDGSFPLVRIMSEIAGMASIFTAAELLSYSQGGRGVLLGGVSGVPPAKVVILGAGVVGEFATKTALGLGASVRIFDNNISKLMRIQNLIGRHLHTSTFNPVYLGYQLISADVVVGAVHSKTGRSPILVTEEMVAKMKPGAVIVDVSIDQGGCIETTEVTNHKNPTIVKHDVVHYGVPNIASKVPRTASVAISNIITPLLIKAGNQGSIEALMYEGTGVRNGVYTYKGALTNEYLSKRFNLKYQNINLLIASRF